jgi:hypothetical protein
MPRTLLKLIAVVTMLAATTVTRAAEPAWKDPGTIIKDIEFTKTKLSEVSDFIRKATNDKIDVFVPTEAGDMTVSVRLKDVTATEAFNAMNQLFEAGNTFARWQLVMNGNRPTAVLNVNQTKPKEVYQRSVVYVGDLVGDGKDGTFPLNKIVDTIHEVTHISGGASQRFRIYTHEATQLLIVCGTADEIKFVRATIEELQKRVKSQSIVIEADETVSIGGQPTTLDDLSSKLKQAGATPSTRIVIRADSSANYKTLAAVLTRLQAAGYRSISVATKQ